MTKVLKLWLLVGAAFLIGCGGGSPAEPSSSEPPEGEAVEAEAPPPAKL